MFVDNHEFVSLVVPTIMLDPRGQSSYCGPAAMRGDVLTFQCLSKPREFETDVTITREVNGKQVVETRRALIRPIENYFAKASAFSSQEARPYGEALLLPA